MTNDSTSPVGDGLADLGSDLAVPHASPQSLADKPLADVREYRNLLIEEEERVSYWRRLIQMRLDLIKREKEDGHVPVEKLVRSLGATGSGHRRQQLLNVNAQDELPQLPGLDDLWTSAIDPSDPVRTEALVEELNRVEQQLSTYRRALHDCIDTATAELIARYKADPNLSLELFPVDVT